MHRLEEGKDPIQIWFFVEVSRHRGSKCFGDDFPEMLCMIHEQHSFRGMFRREEVGTCSVRSSHLFPTGLRATS